MADTPQSQEDSRDFTFRFLASGHCPGHIKTKTSRQLSFLILRLRRLKIDPIMFYCLLIHMLSYWPHLSLVLRNTEFFWAKWDLFRVEMNRQTSRLQ